MFARSVFRKIPLKPYFPAVRIGFCLILVFLSGCGGRSPEPATADENVGKVSADDPFEDVSEVSGLDFVNFNGMSGEFYICEIVSGGGAFLDYDNDGDLDVFFAQGRLLGEGKTMDDAIFPYRGENPPRDRLFRNDLSVGSSGDPVIRFTDVTETSGISGFGYGMGAAVGDYDNDGWQDLYVTNFGSNQLYRNNGNGTFSDVTFAAGADDASMGVSASFFDFDRDGWLDLFIGNYLDYAIETNEQCFSGTLDYCHPTTYPAVADRLLRNLGDGSFEDVTIASGISKHFGRALGVITADFNGDAWPDIYVANDGTANQLWLNLKDGTFAESAMLAGCALNETGVAEASMGIDAGDFDGDGDEDLFMTHNRKETNTLYVNRGDAFFTDKSLLTGLGAPSIPFSGFGTAWFDFDNDGQLDLFAANGSVGRIEALAAVEDVYPYHQPNRLYRNTGTGRFRDVSGESGPVFERSEVSRGTLFGDVDNDGDTDLLVVNNSGPARLLRNSVGNRNPWLGLRLYDKRFKRDMLGTRVAVFLKNGTVLWRRVRNDGSYASANDPRVLVGLGTGNQVEKVRAIWPDGYREEWVDVALNRWTRLERGTGSVSQ